VSSALTYLTVKSTATSVLADPGVIFIAIAAICGATVYLVVRRLLRDAVPSAPRANTSRRIVGSFVSVCIGWLAGVSATTLYTLVVERSRLDVATHLVLHAVIVGVFVSAVWLFILVPLAIVLPVGSAILRVPISTSIGAAAGAVLMMLFSVVLGFGPLGLFFFIPEAVVIGCVTGLVAGFIARAESRND
jgi:hypothetical protein